MSPSSSTHPTGQESVRESQGRPSAPSAVGYVRLSQESDHSIAAQKAEMREFCAEQRFDLVQIYDDGERASGFDASRPAYQEMLVTAEEGGVDVIAARDRDRLSRDRRERAALLNDLDELDIDVYATESGECVDLDDGEEWLMEMLRAYMDDVHKRREIERARCAVERRVEQGYYQGRPPFGLQFDDAGQYLVPDPDEFHVAREILGRRDRGESYREIGAAVGVTKDVVAGVLDRREKYERADR